jgi:predicted RNase H-like nuclease (RuvC/YqgF family)
VETAAQGWAMIKIGIDPGVHTGFAVAEDGKLTRLETLDFWKVYHIVSGLIDEHGSLCVIIEVPKTKANWHNPAAAHNVGRVCREAELLACGLELIGAQVERVHPKGKVDAVAFARITKWKGRTNEHQRDAGMLVITARKYK